MNFSPGEKFITPRSGEQQQLDVAIEATHCELCPRRCGVNRQAGRLGFCKAGSQAQVFRYGAHPGEEPPISGTRGSGAVFFSRCTLRCLYCQNYPWSQEGEGETYSVEELAGIFRRLREEGCHNWNLISPTPWLAMIVPALAQAGRDGKRLPVVYNTSGFERVATIGVLRGIADVYLTDLRYSRRDTALAGSEEPAYVELARSALLEMWRQVGPLRCDEQGLAVSGVICRLLILPGHADEARENLEWLAATVGTGIALSVMAQYIPAYRAVQSKPWSRRISREEFQAVWRKVESLGFSQGWIQDYESLTNERLVGFNFRPRRK
ncbi:MAG: radical SAM protein [Verrucomicrobia bacterium]|nr:radical SAM protein [Verrucomicrobiota bacterium]MBU4289592.1 radical SAM protein [Verrucomicrobiota bacterium]MBU4428272.1 radical SAM protein [Verrucomicrobiota bacterium]MCG2678734.1 radical SAM protein [Kiritimatiellia bacterium]